MYSIRCLGLWLYTVLLILSYAPGICHGIILHPDHEPDLETWTDHPPSGSIGRWGSNASCVAVSPKYILTTVHQGGGISTDVQIGGIIYEIEEILAPPKENGRAVDLRLIKLHAANLTDYVEIYTGTKEGSKLVTISGFGKVRSDDPDTWLYSDSGSNPDPSTLYGYTWTGSGNYRQRWCTNKTSTGYIDDYEYITTGGMELIADLIHIDFDAHGVLGSTIYEGALAMHDSGGPWFAKISNTWRLVGITNLVQYNGASRFDDPDANYAVRVSSYASWINGILDNDCDPLEGDYNGDCIVDIDDLQEMAENFMKSNCGISNNYCQQTDIYRDGKVDLVDYAKLATLWLSGV